jgi:CubicO group peptidase (beta-lactamase class C family)/uncharacterized protein (DUF302 family)
VLKNTAFVLLCGLVLLGSASRSAAQRGNPRLAFEGQSIDDMIGAFMKEHRIPGMTLAIVQAPYIPRVVGYGQSDTKTGLLASPKTLWSVGQLTQGYTAVAIMQLVEADKLGLDDTVGKYLKGLPSEWNAITIRQLMAHTAGLPDYTRTPGFKPEQAYKPEEILALVKEAPLAFKPGTQVASSGTNFFLLGMIVEKASGETYEAFVTKNQIERMGLKHTMFASDLPKVKREAVEKNNNRHKEFLRERPYVDPTEPATGYAEKDGKLIPVPANSQSAWYAHGAMLASAEDISLWDIGLAGGILVAKKENRVFLYHGVKLNGDTTVPAHCGWRFPGHKGFMDIHGDVPGFSTYLSRFTDPSELVCVTLCANKEGVELGELARRIAGAFDRKLGPPVGPKVMTCHESCYPVATTVDRLQEYLKAKGVDIAARVDHAAAAKKKGKELRPIEVLIFGNPAVGTTLMQDRPSVALDLPLRVVVWQEADGTVWIGHDDITTLAKRHGIKNQAKTIEAMQATLIRAIAHAAAPY